MNFFCITKNILLLNKNLEGEKNGHQLINIVDILALIEVLWQNVLQKYTTRHIQVSEENVQKINNIGIC